MTPFDPFDGFTVASYRARRHDPDLTVRVTDRAGAVVHEQGGFADSGAALDAGQAFVRLARLRGTHEPDQVIR